MVTRMRRTRSVPDTPIAVPTSRVSASLRRRIGTRAEPAGNDEAATPVTLNAATFEGLLRRPEGMGESIVLPPSERDEPLSEMISLARSQYRPLRAGNHLHVSDLIHGCVRKKALCEKYGINERPQLLTLGDQFTFAQGDAIHDRARELFASANAGKIWGKWSCRCKYLLHDTPCTLDETDMDEVCPHCHTPCNNYVEVSVFDDELGIVGNPDLLALIREHNALYVGELKSMAKASFDTLNRALPDHVLQVVFYWLLLRRAGYRVASTVSIFYITKGWVFGHTKPYKEFVLDAEVELRRLDDLIEDARLYKLSQDDDGDLPPRIKCSTRESKDAKTCEVCQLCFQENI